MKTKLLFLIFLLGLSHILSAQTGTGQYLSFDIKPADAILYVDGQIWPLKNGSASKLLALGTHTYRIEAEGYHPEAGSVNLDDSRPYVLDVDLRPAFGWLTVQADSSFAGATVYLNGKMTGILPMNRFKVNSGNYLVQIVKKLYNPFEQKIVISDNEELTITPGFTDNSAKVTLVSDNDAEIFVNSRYLGKGSWSGVLESGPYYFETKLPNHVTGSLNRTISSSDSGSTINLPAPIPVTGTLNINSSPINATLYIDGKEVGKTPYRNNNVLIGQHDIELRMDGYNKYMETVEIKEDSEQTIDVDLDNTVDVRIASNVKGADIYLDDTKIGTTPFTGTLKTGHHSLLIHKEGYMSYRDNIIIDETNNIYNISLQEDRAKVFIRTAYPASLSIDGEPEKETLPARVSVDYGKHVFRVSYKDYRGRKRADITETYQELDIPMKRDAVRRNTLYFEGNYSLNSFVGATCGGYLSNFNMEVSYLMSLTKTDNIYWYDRISSAPIESSRYSLSKACVKAGYMLKVAGAFSITPQAGIDFVHLTDSTNGHKGLNDISGGGFCRLFYGITPYLGLSVSSGYIIPLHQSEGYEKISSVSALVENSGKGFQLKIGVLYNL